MLLKAATVLRTARPPHHPTWVTSGDRVAAMHRGVGAQWWNVRIRHDLITLPPRPGDMPSLGVAVPATAASPPGDG